MLELHISPESLSRATLKAWYVQSVCKVKHFSEECPNVYRCFSFFLIFFEKKDPQWRQRGKEVGFKMNLPQVSLNASPHWQHFLVSNITISLFFIFFYKFTRVFCHLMAEAKFYFKIFNCAVTAISFLMIDISKVHYLARLCLMIYSFFFKCYCLWRVSGCYFLWILRKSFHFCNYFIKFAFW